MTLTDIQLTVDLPDGFQMGCDLCADLGYRYSKDAVSGKVKSRFCSCKKGRETRMEKMQKVLNAAFRYHFNDVREVGRYSFDHFYGMDGKGLALGACVCFAGSSQAFTLDEAAYAVGNETDYEDKTPSNWLVLSGVPGVGKSSLAAATILRLLEEDRMALFVRFDHFYRTLQTTYGEKADFTETQLLKTVAEVDYLVIDEITIPTPIQPNKLSALEAILDYRAAREFTLPTLVTTNWDKAKIYQFWGERIASRLNIGHFIRMRGQVLRPQTTEVDSF